MDNREFLKDMIAHHSPNSEIWKYHLDILDRIEALERNQNPVDRIRKQLIQAGMNPNEYMKSAQQINDDEFEVYFDRNFHHRVLPDTETKMKSYLKMAFMAGRKNV